ncbi:MFS transporter, partial [Caulobacter sp. CCH9-E1]|uniref:MFS transporter n=1 Tax=Caulobacter sp. CCH9-E1 TaxID=1768768 RepID=UPI000832073E
MTGRRLRRLSWVQLAALSAPAFVATGYLVPMAVFMPAFLSEHVGLSLTAVGSILLIGRLWDVFNDPIMGALTDATQTPIGRRRPWILAGAPLALLATWALYFAKPGMSAASVTAWMIVLFAGWTMVVVAHGAWGAELSDSYDERSRIFGAKTMAVALSLPVFVLGPAILERTGAASPASQMALMGLTVITTLPLAVAALIVLTPETKAWPVPLSWRALAEAFGLIFTRRAFAMISLVYFLVGAAEAAGASVFMFLVRDALELPNWTASFLVVQALCCLVSLPVWLRVSRRTDKRRALWGVFVLMAVVAPIPLFLPVGGVAAFAAYSAAKGLTWGAEYTLLRSIVADLVAEEEDQGRGARAGVFYASFNLTYGVAQALGGALALWALAAMGFRAGEGAGAPPSAWATPYVRLN